MKRHRIRRGAALVVALVTLLVVTLMTGTVVRSLLAAHRQSRLRQDELQAQWLAESAVARARAQLVRQSEYTGETWQPMISVSTGESMPSAVIIAAERIESRPSFVRITVDAIYRHHRGRRITVQREYTVPLRNTQAANQPPAESRP
jgi:Tfp pilus assembly protein PilX